MDPNGSSQDAQIDAAFQNWAGGNIQAAIITADPLFNNHIDRIVNTAAHTPRTIPAIYQWREFAEAGGLISYGPDLNEAAVNESNPYSWIDARVAKGHAAKSH